MTNGVAMSLRMDQPTTRRDQTSITAARYRNPALVGIYVISATQMWSGPEAVNSLRTRSGAGPRSGFLPGSGHFTAAVNPLDAGLAHEPGHPLATHSHTLGRQLGVHTGRSIGATRPAVDVHNLVPQSPIRSFPGGWRAVKPCVVAAGRAHPGDRTCAAPDSWPGWLSRTQTPPGRRSGLLGEPGRCFCQDLFLLPQDPVLPTQPAQLVALGSR